MADSTDSVNLADRLREIADHLDGVDDPNMDDASPMRRPVVATSLRAIADDLAFGHAALVLQCPLAHITLWPADLAPAPNLCPVDLGVNRTCRRILAEVASATILPKGDR